MNGAGMTGALTMVGGGAGYPSVVMNGGSGNDTMVAGAASDVFQGGSGNNTFWIGAGADNASSTYTITDFNSNDSVFLGGTFSSAQMLANAVTTGSGIILKLSNGAQIMFANLTSTAQLNGHIAADSALTIPVSGVAPTTVTSTGYTIVGTLQGGLATPIGDLIGNGVDTTLTVSNSSVSGLSITASDLFYLLTAAGDTLSGQAGSQTITSSGGNFTFSGAVNNQTLTLGTNTLTITGTTNNLNLDNIANFGPGEQIVVTGALFTEVLYNSATGVLQLDNRINLQVPTGLAGNFEAAENSAGGYTTVALSAGMPDLVITYSGSSVIVSWPDPNTNSYTLQQTANLAAGNWTTNSSWTTSNGTNSLNLTLPTGNLFFRLLNQPSP